MEIINEKYYQECNRKSDINEHLPTLKKYSEQCSHITELGVRGVVSTWAFLSNKPKRFVCLDIAKCPIETAQKAATENNIQFKFILGDSAVTEIEPTEFLFIDTHHVYGHLKKELKLHGSKVSKYMAFHDTSKGGTDPTYPSLSKGEGCFLAIQEFLSDNPEWELKERFTNCYGLTIIGKKDLPNLNLLQNPIDQIPTLGLL
jgi:hypothetical protein